MSKTAWLQCEVQPGMFDGELAISITTAEGATLSFFMPSDLVKKVEQHPAIPVAVLDRNGDVDVVALPRRSFEGPNGARVPARALVFA